MSTIVPTGERFGHALSVQKPLQMIGVEELGNVGLGMVLYPLSTFRATTATAASVYTAISRVSHQKNVDDQMQTRDKLYDRIVGYLNFEQKLDALFASKR